MQENPHSPVPQKCSYRPKNAGKSTYPDFSRLRPKNALKLKGSDMGMPLQNNTRKSTMQYLLFLWPKNERKSKGLALFSLAIINAKKICIAGHLIGLK